LNLKKNNQDGLQFFFKEFELGKEPCEKLLLLFHGTIDLVVGWRVPNE
jgi:hypothetical protein